MQDDAPNTWPSLLDEFDARLEAYAATLNGAEKPPAMFVPPGIGRLPSELKARAELIRIRQRDLEARLTDRLLVLRGILARRSQPPGSIYVDTRA